MRAYTRLLLMIASTAASVLAVEWHLREFDPQPTYAALLNGSLSAWTESDLITYTLKPSFRGVDRSRVHPTVPARVTINASGLRGPELRPRSRNQLLILGDSYTFGMYLADDETYPAQFQSLLDEGGVDAQVLNAGYAGGSQPDQQYVWLREVGVRFEPTVIILGFFSGNDFAEVDFSAWQALDRHGLPTRWASRDTYVDASGRLRRRMPNVGTAGADLFYRLPVLRDSHAFVLLGRHVNRMLFRRRGGFEEAAFAHIFGEFSAEFLESERTTINLIAGMKDIAARTGSEFVVVLIPINFMVDHRMLGLVIPAWRDRAIASDYYARFAELLAARGIASLDIGAFMRESTDGPFFPSDGEVHFSPRGARFTAERLFEFVNAKHLLR